MRPGIEPRTLAGFRVLIVEFHRLGCCSSRSSLLRVLSPAFEALLEQFGPVPLDPGHVRQSKRSREVEIPRTMEFAFLRRARMRPGEPPLAIPLLAA